ncbi:hypothetical protein Q4567_22115 [Aliiglaciecola sp. 2_MG-2023]|uniref:hypothetical protein n=1 Tax=unclassified Aliiglaciecola TaxID=2593648 RepID=UPI0026E47979|nr:MULTISPECIES: hypothetical protein [unclassified Aliiglaciecola]MDO6713436.1 hypothetical protein [Aliiglaciecola sp. 2_MG-2023]MDO6754577.1 hypothetical protein [Aliiglaciecola sp. 1_MG-2023]
MKTEKELLAEFTELVFGQGDSAMKLTKDHIMTFPISDVRQVAQDALEVCSHMKITQRENLESELLKLGLPSLVILKNESYKTFLKITSRGRITKEDDWRMVRSLLDTDTLNENQKIYAAELLDSFEYTRT